MRIHLSRRRTIIAATAAAVAFGSAGAYAISLPELPVKIPGLSLDVPIDLPNPLISPPDTQLPANPIVGPPDGDELSDITKVLDPASAEAKQGLSPAAKRPVPASQTAQAPSGTPAAAPAPKDPKALEDLLSRNDWSADDWAKWAKDNGWSDEDWAKWAEDHPDGSISVTIGRGINICNNNNVKVIVNRDSSNDENAIEQHNSGGSVVTEIDGQHTDTEGPGISCQH
ncbi:MAG TPA: hypothetical protein VII47_09930 [Actinomycetota bacterium]